MAVAPLMHQSFKKDSVCNYCHIQRARTYEFGRMQFGPYRRDPSSHHRHFRLWGGATVCPPTRSSSPLTWLPALHPQPPADAVFLGVWRPGAHRQEASPVQKLPEAGHGGLAQKTVSDHDSDPWQGVATGFLLAP